MAIALITILAAGLFATFGLLATALFQLRRDISEVRTELRSELSDVSRLIVELRAAVAGLRGRLEAHLAEHGHAV